MANGPEALPRLVQCANQICSGGGVGFVVQVTALSTAERILPNHHAARSMRVCGRRRMARGAGPLMLSSI